MRSYQGTPPPYDRRLYQTPPHYPCSDRDPNPYVGNGYPAYNTFQHAYAQHQQQHRHHSLTPHSPRHRWPPERPPESPPSYPTLHRIVTPGYRGWQPYGPRRPQKEDWNTHRRSVYPLQQPNEPIRSTRYRSPMFADATSYVPPYRQTSDDSSPHRPLRRDSQQSFPVVSEAPMVEASDVGDFSSHKMRRIEKSFPDSRGDEKLTKPSCAIASSSSKLDEAARSPNVEKIFSDTTSIASSVASLLPSLTTEQEDSSASKPANSDGDASAAKKQFGCDVSEDCPRIESSSVKLDAVGTKHESERIAVGTRVEVHTYPSNSDEEPRWYGAEVISLELVMGDPFKVEFDVSYDEDPSFIDTIVWPTDAGDIRVLPSLAGRQKKRRRKKPAGSSSSASLPAEFIRDLSPSFDEVSNMLQFFTCQLRAEYAEIVACSSAALLKEERCGPSRRAAYEEFDAEMRRYCEGEGFEWRDVASCAPFMAKFLLGKCARGDKWVPWHAALGSHERYILEVVTRLPLLRTERERHVLCYVFSGSREIKLFESLLRPLYEENALEEDRALGRQILDDPSTAFARDGELHRRFAQYRKLGERLHTTAYLCHPPRGASGDEFVYYVVDRTRRFVEIGQAAFDCIEKNRGVLDSNDLRSEVEKLLMGFREIGPTMTKMFTVTTHLSYPDLGLLDSRCTVGDGADRAFDFLYPEVKKSATTRSNLDRSRLLENLFEHLRDRCDDPTLLTRRFRHMLEWVSQRARERFSSFHPDSLLSSVTHYDLQVNLCEWRKFRCSVDATGLLKSGSVLSPDIDPSDSIHSGTKKRKQKQHASPQQQMFVI